MSQGEAQEKFYELSYYTLAHPDPAFIHQHIVDAFTAQTADRDTKPIAVAFTIPDFRLLCDLRVDRRRGLSRLPGE